MKIAAGIPQASALDVWLRDAEITETKNQALASTDGPLATASADNPATAAADKAAAASGTNAMAAARANSAAASDTASPRDTAEILLDLDVWNGSGSSRALTSSAPPPADDGPDTPAQSWTEHIFGPLL
jgi:hypothetical protein